MNIDKIREALKMAHSAFRENGYFGEDQLAEALAELDKPAEPVVSITTGEAMAVIDQATDGDLKRNDPDLWEDLRKEFDFFLSQKMKSHPPQAAGLTVDEIKQIVLGIERELDHRETIEVEGLERLRVRLTAAIEAKQHLNS